MTTYNMLSPERKYPVNVLEKDFKKMMGHFATGVAIATTHHGDKPVGVTINTLTSVSLTPPLVLFCLGKRRVVFPTFFESSYVAIHILAADQQHLCKAFAQTRHCPWEDIPYTLDDHGSPVIPGCLGVLQCRREKLYEGGDHLIFLNHVEHVVWDERKYPLVYYQGEFAGIHMK